MKKRIVAVLFFSAMSFLLANSTPAKPNQSYVLKDGESIYQYNQTKLSEDNYFFKVPTGTTYSFEVQGKGIKDNLKSRNLIMEAVQGAYFDQSMKIDVSKTVKLSQKGFCVPSVLKSSGAEGKGFAIDFMHSDGLISGFVLGSSLPCSMAAKF